MRMDNPQRVVSATSRSAKARGRALRDTPRRLSAPSGPVGAGESGEDGIRTSSQISTKTVDFGQGGAKSGALAPESTSIDPPLATIIDAWPTLPDAIRAGILAMVRAAGG